MKFFKQNTRNEYNNQVQRHAAEEDEHARAHQETNDAAARHHIEKAKEGAQERKQNQRRRIYDSEIAKGERSPGGTKEKKRKVSDATYIIRLETEFVIIADNCRT